MPSPFKLTQIYQALTAKNPILKRKLKLGTKEISQPPIKQDVEEIEVVNRFIRDNPRTEKAGGGRIGYRKAGDVDPPKGNELEIAENKYSEKYNKTGIDLWKELKQFERSNIRQKQTTGGTGGVPGGKHKKNQIGKDDFIKLVNANKDKTYNEFVELLKDTKQKIINLLLKILLQID